MPKIGKYELGKRITRQIFLVSFIVVTIGYLYDLLFYTSKNDLVRAGDILCLFCFTGCLIYFFFKKKNFEVLFQIGGYLIIASIYFSLFVEQLKPDVFSSFFMRNTLFVCFVSTMLTIGVGRVHAFISGGICLVMTTILIFTKGNTFLISNYALYVIVILGYVTLISYFMRFIDMLLKDIMNKSELISEQNTELSQMNNCLIESQIQLKLQSAQLTHKNEQLEEVNKQKDLFLSIIAHDLRNPVSAMYGFSHILISKYEIHNDERRMLILQNMMQLSHQTSTLLNNLLDWNRNKTNALVVHPQTFDLRETIASNISLMELLSAQKDITIRQDLQTETMVYADMLMIETVLRNVLSNAIKFSHVGGEIQIRCTSHEGGILLLVRDSGVGMDQAMIERISDNTSSSITTTLGTNGEKGTGLGLAICKEFIIKNNGRFWVESEKDKGSTFCILLPQDEITSKIERQKSSTAHCL